MISIRILSVIAVGLVLMLVSSLVLLEGTQTYRLRIAASGKHSEAFELSRALEQVAEAHSRSRSSKRWAPRRVSGS